MHTNFRWVFKALGDIMALYKVVKTTEEGRFIKKIFFLFFYESGTPHWKNGEFHGEISCLRRYIQWFSNFSSQLNTKGRVLGGRMKRACSDSEDYFCNISIAKTTVNNLI
jgi:hypothetical protein